MVSQSKLLTVQSNVDVKAVKEDDTSVPVHLWYDILISTYPVLSMLEGKLHQCLCTDLNKFSNFILRIWFQSVYSSFERYLQTQCNTGTQLYIFLNGTLDKAES